MTTLSALILLALLLIFWQGHMSAREAATRAAMNLCQQQGYQFLDGSVALSGTGLVRSRVSLLSVRRVFQFTYSPEGATRHTGFVIMIGRQVDSIGI
jgi:hypothetical protein